MTACRDCCDCAGVCNKGRLAGAELCRRHVGLSDTHSLSCRCSDNALPVAGTSFSHGHTRSTRDCAFAAAPLLLSAAFLALCSPIALTAESPTSDPTMSKANQNDDEGDSNSRTQRQTRVRTREEEEKGQPEQPSAHISPAMRIYRHALESIFAMLELSDLSRILAVSRAWSAAVRSMAPILASVERNYRSFHAETPASHRAHRWLSGPRSSHRHPHHTRKRIHTAQQRRPRSLGATRSQPHVSLRLARAQSHAQRAARSA